MGTVSILRELERQVGDSEFFAHAPFADMSDRRLMLKIILILEEKLASLGESAAVPGW